ncbi:hypothetical protein [Sphingopyxis sp. GW247-27LB]|uniref:hypothetical protein n=1 Tax=Sphingopyxis sp. GW247-27LB TaxID=2012632 RepID=UPI001595760B|nr:hypothetical protein [Sphingopyxis sp. GW247-27LB]
MTCGQSSEKFTLQIKQFELTLEELEGEAEVADVIEKFGSGWPASRRDELMPWN